MADDLPDTDLLTPTQELVMEVLAARYRLGENTWTFGKRHGHALASLAYDGYVGYKSGVVQDTWLAWMTPEGRAAALDPDYEPQTVCASGDDVGNVGDVDLLRRGDGTVALSAKNRREKATVWLSKRQVIHLATALLNAVAEAGEQRG